VGGPFGVHPVAAFVDPGKAAGLVEVFATEDCDRFVARINETYVPNVGCAWRNRSRAAELVDWEWGGIEWPLVVIEQTETRRGKGRRNIKTDFGLGLNTGVWAILRGRRFDIVNAGTWKVPGWEMEPTGFVRQHKLGRVLGVEKNANAFDALGLAGWYMRHHDIREYAKFLKARPELSRVDAVSFHRVSWPPVRD